MTKAYHYKLCGLDNVWLENGFRFEETDYGRGVAIENVKGLHRAIARDLALSQQALRGQDVRFLRKEMGLSQSSLALLLGVNQQTVARYEKDETEIHPSAERLLRGMALVKIVNDPKAFSDLFAKLADLDELENGQRRFRESVGGWRVAA